MFFSLSKSCQKKQSSFDKPNHSINMFLKASGKLLSLVKGKKNASKTKKRKRFVVGNNWRLTRAEGKFALVRLRLHLKQEAFQSSHGFFPFVQRTHLFHLWDKDFVKVYWLRQIKKTLPISIWIVHMFSIKEWNFVIIYVRMRDCETKMLMLW